ncbi:MAG TPA: Ig-like domain-containing protein [Longimicrobiaceae bacterium]|nr:Ig-like domain-containing protein [Longimicrobiaceae bacterium]
MNSSFLRYGIAKALLVTASLLLSLGGCDDPAGPAVASVEVTAPAPVVPVGRTLQLTAAVLDPSGGAHTGKVRWSSSDPSVATVDQAGVVEGVKPGRVRIAAAAGGKSGEVELTVTSIASMTIQPPNDSLFAGSTYQLAVRVLDGRGAPVSAPPVAWSSSDTLVARIIPAPSASRPALLAVLKPGEVTISAESEGVRATATFTVHPADWLYISSYPPPVSMAVGIGGTAKLHASLRDRDSNLIPGRPIRWSSSDPGVISVTDDGVIRGLARGTATITASAEGARSASLLVHAERGYAATRLPLEPTDLGEKGQVAGREYVPGSGYRPALWDNGRIVWSGPLASGVHQVVVNDSGHVAWSRTPLPGGQARGFVWKGAEIVEIAPPDSAVHLYVTGINQRGQVVGYWSHDPAPSLTGSTGNAFLWEDGRLTDLGRFGGERAVANGINGRGQILVTVWPQPRVLLLENGKRTDVASGEGVSINDHGDVIVQQGGTSLILRHGGSIELPAGHRSSFHASDVNAGGQVVGYHSSLSGLQAFVRRDGRLYNPRSLILDGPDRGHTQAAAINDAGQLLVRADEWLLLTPVP